jgi:hypothetical protein
MRTQNRHWLLLAGVIILIATHSVILYLFSRHFALSSAVIVGMVVLVIAKHLGLLGPLYALVRKAWRR